jgi:hypothetical protein
MVRKKTEEIALRGVTMRAEIEEISARIARLTDDHTGWRSAGANG